jgi:putative FmdB family regulatory protein
VTYEYQCTACHHEWEAEQKITAKPITDCPKCKQGAAKRLISKSAFILHGEGRFKSGGY